MDVRDGELHRLDRKTKKPATPDRKQHGLFAVAPGRTQRGYSPGWVAHKYRAMFDMWPRNMRDVPAAPTAELLSWLKSQQIAFSKAREKHQEGRNHV